MKYAKLIVALCMLLAFASARAKDVGISRSYVRMPLSEALRDIGKSSKDKKILFIYDQLEDYSVTCSFRNLSAIEAVYRVVGLYPIRVAQNEKSIVVEPRYNTENKLIGQLINEKGEPVEFASIRLYSHIDSTFITGGASNENGDFVIPTTAVNARMEISCLGYMPQTHNITVGKIGTFVVYTNPTILKGITVSANSIEFVDDHIEARPTSMQVNHSFNIFSLLNLQPFPGFEASHVNNSISAFGKSVITLVNGIERDNRYLLTIQPKDVAKIKYYSTIPAKYANSGAGAVIDIILKDINEGGSFYAQPRAGLTARMFDTQLGGTYNQGKSEFALQYFETYRNYHHTLETKESSYIGDDFRVDILDDNRQPFHFLINQLTADYTLRPDKTSAFVVTAELETRNHRRYTYGEVTDTHKGSYNRKTSIREAVLLPKLSAFYQKNWDGGKQFETSVAAVYSPEQDYSRVLTDSVYATSAVEEYRSVVETDYTGIAATLFYQQPLNERNHLAFKISNTYSYTKSNYTLQDYLAENKNYRMYAYGAWNSKIGKTRLSAQAGMELQSIKNNSQKWTKPFANASLTFGVPFGKSFDFECSARLTPIIPSLSYLVDHELQYDEYLTVKGNPTLKTGYYLDMQQRLWWSSNKFWINASISEYKGYSPIYLDYNYAGNGKFIQNYKNARETWQILPGVSIGTNPIFDGHFSGSLNATYGYYYARLADGDKNTFRNFSCNLQLFGYFGNWTVKLQFVKAMKALNITQTNQSEQNTAIVVDYRLNKHFHLQAMGYFLFNKNGSEYRNEGLDKVNPWTRYYRITDNANTIMVGFRYDINFGRIFGKVKRNSKAETGSADVQFVQ